MIETKIVEYGMEPAVIKEWGIIVGMVLTFLTTVVTSYFTYKQSQKTRAIESQMTSLQGELHVKTEADKRGDGGVS